MMYLWMAVIALAVWSIGSTVLLRDRMFSMDQSRADQMSTILRLQARVAELEGLNAEVSASAKAVDAAKEEADR